MRHASWNQAFLNLTRVLGWLRNESNVHGRRLFRTWPQECCSLACGCVWYSRWDDVRLVCVGVVDIVDSDDELTEGPTSKVDPAEDDTQLYQLDMQVFASALAERPLPTPVRASQKTTPKKVGFKGPAQDAACKAKTSPSPSMQNQEPSPKHAAYEKVSPPKNVYRRDDQLDMMWAYYDLFLAERAQARMAAAEHEWATHGVVAGQSGCGKKRKADEGGKPKSKRGRKGGRRP